jgi:solute:Na+ symporter, SSS family
VTILVSLLSRPKPANELHNLVYGLTNIPNEPNVPWYKRPAPLALVVVVAVVLLNLLFW